MTQRERERVVELLRCAADDNGCLTGVLVTWPEELSEEQCDAILAAHHDTYFRRPFDTRDRVQACLEAARLFEEGDVDEQA